MDIQFFIEFFKWCSIINGILLLLSIPSLILFQNWVYKVHGKWFSMSRESFNVVIYGFLGFFKICVILFNIVPYAALLLMK